MNHLQNQSYNLWFNFLADKIMEWRDAKPLNSDLKNCIKGMNEVGQYVNQLRVENQVLVKRISMIRNDKNEIIQSYKQQIQQLEHKNIKSSAQFRKIHGSNPFYKMPKGLILRIGLTRKTSLSGLLMYLTDTIF